MMLLSAEFPNTPIYYVKITTFDPCLSTIFVVILLSFVHIFLFRGKSASFVPFRGYFLLFRPTACPCNSQAGVKPYPFMSGQAKQPHAEPVPMAMDALTNLCIYRSSLASHLQVRHPPESFYAI